MSMELIERVWMNQSFFFQLNTETSQPTNKLSKVFVQLLDRTTEKLSSFVPKHKTHLLVSQFG